MTRLEELPDRMDRLESQFLQLRTEMRDEFSAVRQEIHEGDDRVLATLRQEIREVEERVVTTLRDEIREGDAETRRFMRVLFEEYAVRLKVIDEGRPEPEPKRKRAGGKKRDPLG
ncbi:MAG TPA: hypothetical protein VM364_03785 [Vicinamibacterales bacterium]|nr:hypothetical protein [Vicinamibacterales bacterium]